MRWRARAGSVWPKVGQAVSPAYGSAPMLREICSRRQAKLPAPLQTNAGREIQTAAVPYQRFGERFSVASEPRKETCEPCDRISPQANDPDSRISRRSESPARANETTQFFAH